MSLFGTPQQQQSFFQSPFQQQQQSLSISLFQPQQQQQNNLFNQQQQQQQQQQQLYLFTIEKAPGIYNTKWADLHPDSQKALLAIESRILEYRDESQRLEQCNRLFDSSVAKDEFVLDKDHIIQELGGISTAMERERFAVHELMVVVKDMMRNTEVAVRSFMTLCPRFTHPITTPSSNVTAPTQVPGATLASNASNQQQASNSIVPIFDFYSGFPRRPSPFLQHTFARFEKYLGECRQWLGELEQVLLSDSYKNNSGSDGSLIQSLPKVLSNVHDFFVHVAAKVESLHQCIGSMKTAYVADQRRKGDGNNPFLEADRRELAKQQAAEKRVHPTLHLPAPTQPTTQVAGLFASSPMPGGSNAPPQQSMAAPSASSGSGFSLWTTPASTSASSFVTPAQTASTTSFASSVASPQNSIFGPASTPLFGTASTPSLFTSSPSPSPSVFGTAGQSFSSTPAPSLFGTGFGTTTSIGSGASFGNRNRSKATARRR